MRHSAMPTRVALGLALTAALAACTAPAPDPAPAGGAPSASDATADAPPSTNDANPPPAMPAPESAMPTSDTPDGDRDLGKWLGYGDLAFGMDEADARKAWGGELNSYEFEDKKSCFHLWPKGQKNSAQLAFMFVDGKFARYSSESPVLLAPGGGRIGMTGADIDKLYSGRIERQPHKYTDGEYLRIKNGENVLIFETDAKGDAGKVGEWRVGRTPAIDYVEGCA